MTIQASLLVFFLLLAGCSGPQATPGAAPAPERAAPPAPRVCTMDARRCPDGSYVSRNAGRNCEFNPCPAQ